MINSTD